VLSPSALGESIAAPSAPPPSDGSTGVLHTSEAVRGGAPAFSQRRSVSRSVEVICTGGSGMIPFCTTVRMYVQIGFPPEAA
jgi:hypothetical protein